MSAFFWETVATYCHELAPVVGPLMAATGNTAAALHRAECETRQLESQIAQLRAISPSMEDPDGL